jgi:transaldolase
MRNLPRPLQVGSEPMPQADSPKPTAMKFFIDTADLGEIKEAAAMGVLDGVTTNPSLVKSSAAKSFHDLIVQICELVDGDVSAEVTATDFDGIMREGRTLAALHDNVVVKVPLIKEGIKAIRAFDGEGIRTNCTLCFSPTQALIAAKAGATYISPFIGRLDDVSHDGMDLIRQIVTIYTNYGYETEVLAASIRHPVHVVEAALAGADVATMPFKVIEQLLRHPLTDIGLEKFLADWKSYEAGLKDLAGTTRNGNKPAKAKTAKKG